MYAPITTDKQVQSLKPGTLRYERTVSHPKGLVVIVAPGTGPAFYLRYVSQAGHRRRFRLGAYSKKYGLAEARSDAIIRLAEVEKGGDPAAERSRSRRTARTGASLNDLLEPYLQAAAKGLHGGRQEPRRASALELHKLIYDKHIRPKLGDRPYSQITTSDVKTFARELATESKLAAATVRGVIAVLRAMLGFAVHEEKIPANPVIGVKLTKANKRERMIDEANLRTIWRALDAVENGRDSGALPLDPQAVRLIQLLFLTGLRRAEVAGAAWSEFDLTAKLWTIPAARMKANRPHTVPLSESVMKLLGRIKAATAHLESDFLFPMAGDAEKPVRPDRVTAEFARMVQHQKLPTFSPHDVRRTCTTVLRGRYNVPEKDMKQVLAHSRDEGVISHYDLHDYLPEKRAALVKWAKHLDSLLRDDPTPKVVKLERRGRS